MTEEGIEGQLATLNEIVKTNRREFLRPMKEDIEALKVQGATTKTNLENVTRRVADLETAPEPEDDHDCHQEERLTKDELAIVGLKERVKNLFTWRNLVMSIVVVVVTGGTGSVLLVVWNASQVESAVRQNAAEIIENKAVTTGNRAKLVEAERERNKQHRGVIEAIEALPESLGRQPIDHVEAINDDSLSPRERRQFQRLLDKARGN